jgi:hypothetical protein
MLLLERNYYILQMFANVLDSANSAAFFYQQRRSGRYDNNLMLNINITLCIIHFYTR